MIPFIRPPPPLLIAGADAEHVYDMATLLVSELRYLRVQASALDRHSGLGRFPARTQIARPQRPAGRLVRSPNRADKQTSGGPYGIVEGYVREMKTAAPVLLSLAVLALFVSADPRRQRTESPTKPKPYYDYREHATPYAGPGREAPEPAGVREVLLGYFGPNDPQRAEGGDAWCAAQMAVEEANRDGGYRGKSFRLVPGWSDNPWKAGVVHVTHMAYTDNVWAILGGIDGPSTHLAEQVVAKACLPLVSPGNTDRTANLANVAWMFSCLPSDHVQAPVLADAMVGRIGHGPFEVLTDEEHDSRCLLAQLRRTFAERRISPRHQYVCRLATDDPAGAVSRVVDAKPAAVVVLAGAGQRPAAAAVGARTAFRAQSSAALRWAAAASWKRRGMRRRACSFRCCTIARRSPGRSPMRSEAFHHEPDFTAAAAYDSVQLTVAAVRKAGLNRAQDRRCAARDFALERRLWDDPVGFPGQQHPPHPPRHDPLGPPSGSQVGSVGAASPHQSPYASFLPGRTQRSRKSDGSVTSRGQPKLR